MRVAVRLPAHGSLECLSYKGSVAIWTRLPQMGKLREAKDILPRWADVQASREKSALARKVEKYPGAVHMGSLATDPPCAAPVSGPSEPHGCNNAS